MKPTLERGRNSRESAVRTRARSYLLDPKMLETARRHPLRRIDDWRSLRLVSTADL